MTPARAHWSGVVGVVAVGAAALVATAALQPAPAGYWAPRGYVSQADSMIGAGLLELRCGGRDSIVTHLAPESPEKRFFDRSYLRSDVRAFNSRPEAARVPFVVEDCALQRVDPYYHRVDLPYNRVPRWLGDLRFTVRHRTVTLDGGGRVLEVRHPRRAGRGENDAVSVPVAGAGERERASLVRLLEPDSPEVLADLFFVGDGGVLADRRDVGSLRRVRINGFALPPGRITRLEPGDWVQVQAARAETWLVEGSERARTASFVRREGEVVRRLYPARRLRPFSRSLAQAMDLALQSVPRGGERPVARIDVDLTLDRELHDALEAVVLERCTRTALRSRPRAASMLVMDGFTGQVRAMPSCPGEAELAPYEPLSGRVRSRFLRNQNLVGHPIGSAGKPFWAAAVSTTLPAFLDLEVEPHVPGPQGSVLGCRLPAPYGDAHGSEGWVGMEEFLRRSCNRYLVDFATAALALGSGADPACRTRGAAARRRCLEQASASLSGGGARPAPPDGTAGRLRFCDQVVDWVFAPGIEAVGPDCGSLQLVEAKFPAAPGFGGLTNVRMYREPRPAGPAAGPGSLDERYRFGRYRLDAWAPLLDAFAAAGDTAGPVATSLRFAGVSPQSANLALNTVEELRSDWVNLLLGGENSRWSNFELAEAHARLLTGRSVRGELGRPVDGEPPAVRGLLSPEVLDPGVRRRILHAMERVAGPGGTAARLAGHVEALQAVLDRAYPDRGYDVYVTAKTGTPAVDRHLGEGRLESRQGSVLVLGLLAVERERGRAASREKGARVSSCSLDAGLRDRILEVPPAGALDPDRDVALTVAVYLDDLEPGAEAGAATALANAAFPVLGEFLEAELARRAGEE